MGFSGVPHFSLQHSRPENVGINHVHVRDFPSNENYPMFPALHVQENARSNSQEGRVFAVEAPGSERWQIIVTGPPQSAHNRPTNYAFNDRILGIGDNNAPHLVLGNVLPENISVNQGNARVPSVHPCFDGQENSGGNPQSVRLLASQQQINGGYQNKLYVPPMVDHQLHRNNAALRGLLDNVWPRANEGNARVSPSNNIRFPLCRGMRTFGLLLKSVKSWIPSPRKLGHNS